MIALIIDQYRKHGWTLRRVLLSDAIREKVPDLASTFAHVEVREAAIDAAWFSRSSRPGSTAWELRHLSAAPYALVETIHDGTTFADAEKALGRTEERLREKLIRRSN